jgi:hypothetical protein
MIHLQLSEKGRRLMQVKGETLKAYVDFMDSVLTPDETVQLSAILSKLLSHTNAQGSAT